MIARTPAIRWIHETHPHVHLDIYWQDYFVDMAAVLLPEAEYPRTRHKRLSEARYMMPEPVVEFDPERLTTLTIGLVEHAFLIMADRLPPSRDAYRYPKPKLILDEGSALHSYGASSAEDYIVFTPGFTAPSRQWPSVFVNRLAKRVRAARRLEDGSIVLPGQANWPTARQSAGLTPVLLGTSAKQRLQTGEGDYILAGLDPGIDRSLFTDLWDKTNLVQALGIIQKAKAVVGVDNGLLHLAACTDTPVVAGVTTLKADKRIPADAANGKTIILEAQVPCQGCQSESFAVNHDWKFCPSPRMNYACTLTMTDERFFQALRELQIL